MAIAGLLLLSIGSAPTPGSEAGHTSGAHDADSYKLDPPNEKGDGDLGFGLALLQQVWRPDQNQVLSGFSVSSALGLAYAGARGDTEAQIGAVLQSASPEVFHSRMARLREAFAGLSRTGQVDLNIANGIWARENYSFKGDYARLCREMYGAEARSLDFDESSAAAQINDWVNRNTRGKIEQLFPPGALSGGTRLVLANAVYFKGKWASRFEPRNTRIAPFHVSPGKQVPAQMMAQKSPLHHYEDDRVQVLEMPYRGHQMSMLLVLPREPTGLAELQEALTVTNLSRWVDGLRRRDVELFLPRFRVHSRFSLQPQLAAMGMTDAFDPARADFSGMTSQRPLFINAVQHSALIEVDEEGTVAAAGTGSSFGCSAPPRAVVFRADHPFVFVIAHRPTRTLLFMGLVVDPASQ